MPKLPNPKTYMLFLILSSSENKLQLRKQYLLLNSQFQIFFLIYSFYLFSLTYNVPEVFLIIAFVKSSFASNPIPNVVSFLLIILTFFSVKK